MLKNNKIITLLTCMFTLHVHATTNMREQSKIFAKSAIKATAAMGLWCAASKKFDPTCATLAVLLMACADEYYLGAKANQHKLLRGLGYFVPLMLFTDHWCMRELAKEKAALKQQLELAQHALSIAQNENNQGLPMLVVLIPGLQARPSPFVMPTPSAPPLQTGTFDGA